MRWLKWKSTELISYCVLSLASVSALILLFMEFINALILLIRISFHSSNNTFLNWARVEGTFRRRILLCPTDARSRTNLDCMVAGRVG